jgi:hypothetical protein
MVEAIHFLQTLLASAANLEFLEIRLIAKDRQPAQHFHRITALLESGFERRSNPGIGIATDGQRQHFFGAMPRSRRSGGRDSLGRAVAVWADFDDEDLQPTFTLPPSIVVATSPPRNKHQMYWLLDEPCGDHDLIERINRAIPGADLASTDAAHMLRLPGFINIKYEDRPRAKLLRCDGTVRYSIDQLVAAFPPSQLVTPRPKRTQHGSAPKWLALVYDAILDFLHSNGYRPKVQASGAAQALCPLHDDRHPSLSLHPEKGFHCFGCHVGGRLTQLAKRLGVRV